MTLGHYSSILSSNLFLQTPVMEQNGETETHPNPYEKISENLEKILTTDSINSKDLYTTYMEVANTARDLIIEFDKIRDEEDLYTGFQLWNMRLTTLLCANELTVAQKEAKRLSAALENVTKSQIASTNSPDQTPPKMLDLFPNEVPLSLKLLIIRLRTQGPNTTLNSEYFKILTDVRMQYTIHENEKSKGSDTPKESLYPVKETFKLGEVLAYAVSGNLIAKREYKTLLTHAESILAPLNKHKSELNESEVLFKDQISFVSMLVAFITGDLTLGMKYIDDVQNLKDLLETLRYILNNVDPVLDYKKLNTGEKKEDVVQELEILDQVTELVEEQAITGRILCSLCALFELRSRDDQEEKCDAFEKSAKYKYPNMSYQLFKLWFRNTNKLYGFE